MVDCPDILLCKLLGLLVDIVAILLLLAQVPHVGVELAALFTILGQLFGFLPQQGQGLEQGPGLVQEWRCLVQPRVLDIEARVALLVEHIG